MRNSQRVLYWLVLDEHDTVYKISKSKQEISDWLDYHEPKKYNLIVAFLPNNAIMGEEEKNMQYTQKGNEKLGKSVFILNRPTGHSCPSDCWFLGNGCYAEFTENRFKRTRKVGFKNLTIFAKEMYQFIAHAIKNNKSIRFHERGDFLTTNSRNKKILDKKYLRVIKNTLKKFLALPHMWVYTHVLDKRVADLQNYGIHVYASVHCEKDVKKAIKNKFKLFAFVLPDHKKPGGSKDYQKYVELPILGRTLVCPEHRLGRQRVTCDKCKWCVEGKGNVVFLTH